MVIVIVCFLQVRQIVGLSPSRVNPQIMKLVFIASLLSVQHLGVKEKTAWLGIRLMCRTCLYLRTVVSVSHHYNIAVKRTWILISRGALMSWNFQNGRRCLGNREHISKYLTSLISETAEGISRRLGIYIKQVWQNILTQRNRERMAAIFKMVADKIGKISMFSDCNEN